MTGRRYTASLGVAGLGGNTRYVNPTVEGVWFLPTHRGEPRSAFALRPNTSGRLATPARCPSSSVSSWAAGISVRGYDIRSIGPQDPNSRIVIGGNKSLLFNAEYLISVGGPVRLILFYDAGQVTGQRPALRHYA